MGKGGRAALVVVLAVLTACTSSSGESAAPTSTSTTPSQALRVEALSTRPEYVSGGDVLIGVEARVGSTLDGVTVTVDGRDVSGAFRAEEGRLVGLVEGLPEGEATITARAGDDQASLDVVNHPISGPLFSGPHQQPFACLTERAGLGPPTDADCTVAPQTTTQDVGGVATTIEKGVIDRSIYTIAVPHSGWNGRLVYRFGGGCGASFSQGTPLVEAADPKLLGQGYAVATSSLNTFQTACNAVLSAEVALMVKEHFIERYGVPRFTIGEGGSGGAIQQMQIAQNYPGILDALSPTVPFPDAASIAPGVTDCGLLVHYYATPGGSALTDAQRVAINGHRTVGTCQLWNVSYVPTVDPTAGCKATLPADQIFDPVTNPRGARCTYQDSNVNIYGRDPATGFANRPLDNVGVQYGLQALDDGVITVDQFLDLNEQIGGYDVDGRVMAERESATEQQIATAYRTGQVTTGAGLDSIPIILTNVYTDAQGDIHDRQRIFAIRERLDAATGGRDPNLVLWTFPGGGDLMKSLLGTVSEGSDAVAVLDEWLTAAAADDSDQPWPTKLAAHKPAGATDTCVLADGQRASGDDVYTSTNDCTSAYPVAADPRRVAGASLANDIMKCALVPVDASTYRAAFTDAQLERLRRTFPDGVCDWSRPGVGQVPSDGVWQRFG